MVAGAMEVCLESQAILEALAGMGIRTMSDIVAEVADVTEFFEEINGLIRLGDALHPDDAAGERDYAIRVIDTMRRLERHRYQGARAALRVALRE